MVAVSSDEAHGGGDESRGESPHRPEAILSAIIHNFLDVPDLVDDPKWDTFSTVIEVGSRGS